MAYNKLYANLFDNLFKLLKFNQCICSIYSFPVIYKIKTPQEVPLEYAVSAGSGLHLEFYCKTYLNRL